MAYKPGLEERRKIESELEKLEKKELEIPLVVGGKEIKTNDLGKIRGKRYS